MADIPVKIYRSSTVRPGTSPSNPSFPADEEPVIENPAGTPVSTYKTLGDTLDKTFVGKNGFTPIVVNENELQLVPLPQIQENGLISGGVVQWTGSGYVFNGSGAFYRIAGNAYSSNPTQVTLSSPDPTNDRIDVFAVDVNSDLIVITGTPAATPVKPQVDPSTQLELTSVIVTAASTDPILTEEVIYDENTEWTGSSSGTGTANFASAVDPFQGSVSIETTNIQNGFQVILDNGSDIDISTFQTFGFQIKLKANLGAGQNIQVVFLDSANVAISNVLVLPLNKSLTSDYQFIGIVLSGMNFTTNLVRKVRFNYVRTSGGTTYTGYFLDIIKLEGGINPPASVNSFLNLSDTPNSYSGQASKVVSVKADESGLEFTTPSSGGLTGSGTTNEIAYFTASTALASLPVSTYPSIAELAYVKGVTSAIQGQINGKQTTIAGTLTNGYVATVVAGVATWAAPSGGGSNWTLGTYGIYRNSNVSINHTPASGDVNIPLIIKPSFADNPPTTNDNNLLQIFGSDGIKRLEFQNDGGLFLKSNATSSGEMFEFRNGSNIVGFSLLGNLTASFNGVANFNNRQFRVGTPTSPNSDTTIKASASLAGSSIFRIDSGFSNGILDIYARGLFKFLDASSFEFGSTTGTKIGTATSQKFAFWNKTPIIQPTTGITGATLVSNLGTPITATDTFGGYTLQQLAAIIINTGLAA